MQCHRLHASFAVLFFTFVMGEASAQAPGGPPPQQQGQGQPQQQAQFQGQPQGQPLLVVPSLQPPVPVGPRPDLPMVELAPLLQRVERASGKQFLVDPRLGTRLYLAGVDQNEVTYPVLLAILRINGWAAFESEGRVNIIPDANVRFHAPFVQNDDASIPADLYVTRVLTMANVAAANLVPILRPMMSQAAHLAAHSDTNQLILEDRYENVQRITAVVRTLDVPPRNAPARN
jgi:general secretion pathway protein D